MKNGLFFLVLCLLFFNISMAESTIKKETHEAGSNLIVFDFNMPSNDLSASCTYAATAYAYDAETLIKLFWPTDDINAVHATKSIREQGAKFDGKQLYTETYRYNGARLILGAHRGTVFFQSGEFIKWEQNNNRINAYTPLTAENFSDFGNAEAPNAFAAQLVDLLALPYEVTLFCRRDISDDGAAASGYIAYEYLLSKDGIYFDNHEYTPGLAEERLIPAQYLTVIWGENGLSAVMACFYNIYDECETEPPLSVNGAMDALTEYLSIFVSNSTIEIRGAVPLYAMVPVKGSMLHYAYVPAWKLKQADIDWESKTQTLDRSYLINALTGEILD